MEGWEDVWMDGWMDGRIDGLIDGIDKLVICNRPLATNIDIEPSNFEKVATNAAHILDVHVALDGMQTVKGAHILNVHIALDGRQIVKGVSGNSLI